MNDILTNFVQFTAPNVQKAAPAGPPLILCYAALTWR